MTKGLTYVDHAGATLYAKSQMTAVHEDLVSHLYGNPHSSSASSRFCTDAIDQTRFRILRFFNTDPDTYSVVFTSGCTGALKLVAETFNFSRPRQALAGRRHSRGKPGRCEPPSGTSRYRSDYCQGYFCYLQDNHTSVQGMRELAAAGRCRGILCLTEAEVQQGLADESLVWGSLEAPSAGGSSLFVFPGQSNYSGRKYPLEWVGWAQKGDLAFQRSLVAEKWFVVLDAACLVSTSPLDLSLVRPDFVTLSFYKMFGFPTGLGALLVRNSSAWVLEKKYFGGGTVAASSARERFCVLRAGVCDRRHVALSGHHRLNHGFRALDSLGGGMEAISAHTFTIAHFFATNLSRLHHSNGTAIAEIYSADGFQDRSKQGAIVNFNLRRANGDYIGFAEVDKLAQLHDIHLRTGCFCNIGACQMFLNITSETIQDNLKAGHVCGDDVDLVNGRPTGSVRVSFGYMSSLTDAIRCLNFMVDCFLDTIVSRPLPEHSADMACSEKVRRLTDIFLYPIKSCGAFRVSEWQTGPRGLLYDRTWMVVSDNGIALGQKREPRLCLLAPVIHLDSGKLELSFPGTESCYIGLDTYETDEVNNTSICTNKICNDKVNTVDCGEAVAQWLCETLERPGLRLLRQLHDDSRHSKRKDVAAGDTAPDAATSPGLSLANEAQFLLISRESVRSLQKKLVEQQDDDLREVKGQKSGAQAFSEQNLVQRFRANLVIDGGLPFDEESWTSVSCGDVALVVYFGVYLRSAESDVEQVLRVGSEVFVA
ncbi:hypothetical protein C0Q70_02804 [Pomacea canaliculata]|uniref:Molybdenum cofactor sulfurase n=1 Tax=Pomacea canaliculata TaxID=400727 RepID=A0A2T7PQZ3_POMCA|nr:hypothetical protein C0Q70_02804 [Pomacea canaliculata]